MPNITQPWVGYLDRSYEQIKKSVLKRLGINNPEISDHTESNPFIIFISIFAGIAEMLNYYIDNMAREAYIGVARRYNSMVKISKLMDYNIKARWYSSVDLLFTLKDQNGIATPYMGSNILIPKGTEVKNNTGIIIKTLLDTYLVSGQVSVYSTAVQYVEINNSLIGVTSGTAGQAIQLPDNYVHDSLLFKIGIDFWKIAYTFGVLGPNSKNMGVVIEEDGKAYAVFGDGVNGMIPAPGQNIYATYKTTDGTAGNLPPDSYNILNSVINLPDNSLHFEITHPQYSSGGTNFEGIEDIRKNAPLSLRTLRRAVTYQDYKDVTELEPGVGAAEVKYVCGKYVDIYIVPKTKGIATQALMASVKDAVNCKKMITTAIALHPSGLTLVYIKVTIFAKPLFSANQTRIDAINALDKEYGFEASYINRPVVISDITTTLELVPSVDRVELNYVRIQPYARPLKDQGTALNITFQQLPISANRTPFLIVYDQPNDKFKVYKNGIQVSIIDPGNSYADTITTFKLDSGNYSNGDTWEFIVFPSFPEIFPTTIINIDDYTMPIIDVGATVDDNTPRTIFGDMEVIEQVLKSSCLPN